MKTQVLFVDDEPLILDGLKRMLRSLRDRWDMHFVESGSKALELMSRQAINVVISDMRMPGMNGAQLLNSVMEQHPQTVRLILSGYADRDLILECVQSTHQFLSKPCDAGALLAAVSRAADLEGSLQNERMRKLIGQMEALPSLPTLYSEIVEKAGDPDVTLEDLAETIARDIAMTAKILKLVNSAFFGLGREIASVSEAISYLGVETIKSLVLTVNAFSQFEGSKLKAVSLEEIWSHSLSVASAAKQIARAEGCGVRVQEEAFVAGMLHDLGKLILGLNFPAEYVEVSRHAVGGESWLEAERASFGVDHADVGGALIGLWGLPGPVVETIALHHRPSASVFKEFSPLAAVIVADALVRDPARADVPEAPHKYLEEIGLQDRLEIWKNAVRNGDE